jgi:hypothetical protein
MFDERLDLRTQKAKPYPSHSNGAISDKKRK